MAETIVRDPEILGGTPCFRGTRVPGHLLFSHLASGKTLDDFLIGYPAVTREMAKRAIAEVAELLDHSSEFKAGAFEAIHSSASAMYKVGAIDKATMRNFDASCRVSAERTENHWRKPTSE